MRRRVLMSVSSAMVLCLSVLSDENGSGPYSTPRGASGGIRDGCARSG